MEDHDSGHDDNSLIGDRPQSKRRRIALACNACRTRKSRCDGARPKCSACSELGLDCAYMQSSVSSNVVLGKEYVSSLEDRVRTLEQLIHSMKDGPNTTSNPVYQNGALASHKALSTTTIQQNELRGSNAPEDAVDAMATVAFADEEDTGFFGPSSNISLVRHISRAVTARTNSRRSWESTSSDVVGAIMNVSRPSTPALQAQTNTVDPTGDHQDIYSLPPEAEILQLVKKYFHGLGTLYPYIYEESFMVTYSLMAKNNFSKVRRTWLALLNMVLAVASLGSVPDPGGTANDAAIFHRRALSLCRNDLTRGTTIEIVHCLLLMSQYLQATQKPTQTWTIHGLAVKAAFQLGLQSAEASKLFSPLEREIRKRTWYACVVLDRTLSMTFGRPSTIPDSYVKLELPTNYESVEYSAFSPETHSSLSVAFFNATINLYKIMWSVVDRLYGQNLGCEKLPDVGETISTILELDRQLTEWASSLPLRLQIMSAREIPTGEHEASSEISHLRTKLRVVLTLRYLNIRVLLHRPILIKFLDIAYGGTPDWHPAANNELPLLQSYGVVNLRKCLESSKEIIEIISTSVFAWGWRQRHSLLDVWWFSLYYTFNATVVILGCIWICQRSNIFAPSDLSILSLSQSARHLPVKAIEAMMRFDTRDRLVDRCRFYLEKINSVLNLDGIEQTIQQSPAAGPVPSGYDISLNSHEQFRSQTSLHDGQISMDTPHMINIPGHETRTEESPLGIEFGEFFLETDMAFLNTDI